MVIPLPAIAADLHEPHKGTSCGSGEIGTWHFVNNQTAPGAGPGTITVQFDTGMVVQPADSVNRRTQHFWVHGAGQTLIDASTDLGGRLVLSEFSCEGDKKKS